MYNQKIMEVFKESKHMGEIRQANAIGDAGNAGVGDILKFYMIVEDEKIQDVKCKVFGSVVAIAVGSVCCDELIGKTLDEALELDINEVTKVLGEIPQAKLHCLSFAKEAIKEAVNYYYKKQEKQKRSQIN